jgi:hypothetical protein
VTGDTPGIITGAIWTSDNGSLVTLGVNGGSQTQLTETPGGLGVDNHVYGQVYNFQIPLSVNGTYALDFDVQNWGDGSGFPSSNPTGLYVGFVGGGTPISTSVPEPGTLLLMALMGSAAFGTKKFLRKRS